MFEPIGCCRAAGGAAPAAHCPRCDLRVGLPGVHVLDVRCAGEHLEVTVESEPGPVGCPDCGVVGIGHGRVQVRLVDIPSFGRPVTICWRKRRFRCPGAACDRATFVEKVAGLAAPRHATTCRVVDWVIEQLRSEHATINGLARQLGTAWHTVWTPVRAALQAMAADPARFDGVRTLGVDEHIWHHVSRRKRGPKELTGMVDLTRGCDGKVQARLLDLVPGRSGAVLSGWLTQRGEDFRRGVEIATLDPFHGYKRAIDDELDDATAVLDAFHVVKLAIGAVDEVRRRLQQQITGHRGRKGDPLFGIRTIIRCDPARLTARQWKRFDDAIAADRRHEELLVAWQVAHALRDAYHYTDLASGRAAAEKILAGLPSCPIPRSPDSARPCTNGKIPSWRTGTPTAPITGAPKP